MDNKQLPTLLALENDKQLVPIQRRMADAFRSANEEIRNAFNIGLAARAIVRLARSIESGSALLIVEDWARRTSKVDLSLVSASQETLNVININATKKLRRGTYDFQVAMIPQSGELIRAVMFTPDRDSDIESVTMIERFHPELGRVRTAVQIEYQGDKHKRQTATLRIDDVTGEFKWFAAPNPTDIPEHINVAMAKISGTSVSDVFKNTIDLIVGLEGRARN